MLVKEVLKLKGNTLYSAKPETPLSDAVISMADHDIGSLVVLESEDGQMSGMLTCREVLRGLDGQKGNLGDLPVSAVMVRDPLVCGLDETSEAVRDRMTQQHVRYVPVVDDGRLLGVISFHDIAKAAIKEASFENRLLKQYIKNWPEESR